MKNLFLYFFILLAGNAISQINLEEIKEPCDCVKLIKQNTEDAYKYIMKEDAVILKDNVVGHFYVDLMTISEYCQAKFADNNNTDKCKELKEEAKTLLKNFEEEVENYRDASKYENISEVDIDQMAQEYCECLNVEETSEMSSCLEEFKEKYVGIKGSDDQKKEFEEKVKEHCGDK